MKTKYSSNRELIHVWAHDSSPEIMKSANSVSCHNDILYSYSTAIGQIIDNNTVIHNTYSYSVTTSKHQSLARQATSHFNNIIELSIPTYDLDTLSFGQSGFNDYILNHNENSIKYLLVKASRSKKYSDYYKAQALSIIQNLEKYALAFNLFYLVPNIDFLTESAIEADKKQKELDKIKRAERIKEQAEALENWRLGLDVRNHFEVTALRIKEDQIETTKGAKIPLDHAIKFWGLIKSWHEKGVSYVKDHHSIHLGNYIVNSFKDDILTVGCHSIPYSEIQGIASQLHLQGA